MRDAPPTLHYRSDAKAGTAVPEGQWTAARLAEPPAWQALQQALQRGAGAGTVQAALAWDLRGIERLDHTGAQLLWNHWRRAWPGQLEALPAQRAVLERVARWSAQAPRPRRRRPLDLWNALGRWVLVQAGHVLDVLALLGQVLLDVLRLLRAPRLGPWRDLSGHLYRIGATALPITALVGALIGVVLAYLIAQQLQLFGADPYIVNLLGLSVIRELGPVLAALLVAGRSGSTITAQIGVMRVTEELDAMKVLGIPTGFRLVMPRVLALALAMPLLSVWTTLAALAGGMVAANLTLGVSPGYFVLALPDAVQFSNLVLATAKSVVFGILIAIVGCHFGLRVRPNTDSLGRGTTAAVVVSITGVIVVDALFAVLFKDVGL
jgi:phospholipid/cholesterol/gamma-HCH transport system permease protein